MVTPLFICCREWGFRWSESGELRLETYPRKVVVSEASLLTMSMRFWKFEYPGPSGLDECISRQSLPSRETAFPSLANTFEHPLKSMHVGDCVVLATLRGEEANIFALGKVRSINACSKMPTIQWKATRHTKLPDERGGLIHWQTKTAFEISPEPAKKYGLRELVDYYVKNDD